jgi:hypothetical protein
MKRIIFFTLSLILILLSNKSQAQKDIPDGSTAPDFTMTDINGNTHNLYSYLNSGKTVILDFFGVS